ncbi:RecT family recombinase [Edwardsiella tarda]|uniref:RecT family recombinase n=1 Tax=Edwardsiella tarda TaxID=636 RepID=UPI003F65BED8
MKTETTDNNHNALIDNVTILTNGELFDRLMTLSRVMAGSGAMVPTHFQKNPDACMAVTMQAARWGMDPFAVAQKTHIVSGTLGYEAQLVNAIITTMSPTKDRLHYDWFGPWENVIGKFIEKTSAKGHSYIAPGWTLADEKGCGIKVWATLRGEDTPRELVLMLSQAQVRNSTLWASDPKQQLAYLAAKRWARLYTPDVLLGVYSTDELEDPQAREEKDITPSVSINDLVDSANSANDAQPEVPADSLDATLGESLRQALEEASTLEAIRQVEQRIAQHKSTLGSQLLFELRGKSQKKRSGYKAVLEIEAAFDALSPGDRAAFQQLENLVKNRLAILPLGEQQRFTLALDDLRAEYA